MIKKSENIIVTYNSPLIVEKEMEICLLLPNSYGYVNEAVALFNKNNQKPGEDANCTLHFCKEKSTEEYSVFIGRITFVSVGYRTFFIKAKINNQIKFIKFDSDLDKAVIETSNSKNLHFWELFVYYKFSVPEWVKGGIMYQIFVDTFCSKDLPDSVKEKVVSWNTFPKWEADSDEIYRNNQFYGGNLRGIIEKLDYIKSLGVNILYLTPIFKSSSSNRYDIDDYLEIDSMVGTWEDLYELHIKANKMGMYLVIDTVFNHSSRDNILFYTNPDIYAWEQRYVVPKTWWGYENLVEFDKNSGEYLALLGKWLNRYSKYVDGIRLDVADNLPDYILKYIRIIFKKYILGEVWKDAVTGDFREFLTGEELDGVMNYQFGNAILRYVRWGNFNYYKRKIEGIINLYPKEALDASPIFISSHDIPRTLNMLIGDFMKEEEKYENMWDMENDSYWRDENGNFNTAKFRRWEFENDSLIFSKNKVGRKLHKIALFLQYTLPGLPSIFAGDEVGVTGFKDPFNRKPFPWDDPDESLYQVYKLLGEFRNTYKHIFSNSSNYKIIRINEKILIYRRDNLLFIVNRTPDDVNVDYCCIKNIVFTFEALDKDNVIPGYGAVAIDYSK